VIPGEFRYHAPETVKEATDLLTRTSGAKILAGGMSLIPAMKHRLAQPPAVIDIGRIAELDSIHLRRGRITLGARVTHAAVGRAPELGAFPIFAETSGVIGDVQVRNRGTFAGSLVHADPASDWPAVFLALEGEAVLVGNGGERVVGATGFFRGMLTSDCREGEILTEVRLPVEQKRTGAAYVKLRQPASGFAVVGVAAVLTLDRKGRCERAAVAVTGVNPVPFRATGLEERLIGKVLDDPVLADATSSLEGLDPMADIHASAEYRRHLAGVFARRALQRAAERAV
jgi:carbon-monoxide dehydrogenase medium subunit